MACRCTECGAVLKKGNFEKSDPRITNKAQRFIKCNGCSNVMIGTFNILDQLKNPIIATPKTKDRDTEEMIAEARKLFQSAGAKIGKVEYSKDVKKVTPDTEDEDNEDDEGDDSASKDYEDNAEAEDDDAEAITEDEADCVEEPTKDVPESADIIAELLPRKPWIDPKVTTYEKTKKPWIDPKVTDYEKKDEDPIQEFRKELREYMDKEAEKTSDIAQDPCANCSYMIKERKKFDIELKNKAIMRGLRILLQTLGEEE